MTSSTSSSFWLTRSARTRLESRSLLERKDVLVLGALHPLFPILLPDLGPRPVVHVEHFVVDDLGRRHRRGDALDGIDGLQALRVHERVTLVEVADLDEIAHDADRLHERLRVVEDRLV